MYDNLHLFPLFTTRILKFHVLFLWDVHLSKNDKERIVYEAQYFVYFDPGCA